MYSQNAEEQIILDYFTKLRHTFNPVFLDLGANDGVTFSNTRRLWELGWYGVLVEPSPKAFVRLEMNYAGSNHVQLFNCAVSAKTGEIAFKESGALIGNDVGLVSTFHDSEKARFDKVVQYTDIKVRSYHWLDFIMIAPTLYDFISMDIEGSELDVLPYMDLAQTRMICIEWNGKADLARQYEKYLKEFRLVYTSGENLIYAR